MKLCLSCTGGGIRGLIPAIVLAEIERRTNRPAYQMFDLMAGTSTGGLLTLCLAAGYSAAEVVELYRTRGPDIFSTNLYRRARSLWGLAGARYSNENLKKVLHTYLKKTTLGEAKNKVMVSSYDLLAREPVFFKSWKDPDLPMTEAALATSAAPTFFDPLKGHYQGKDRVLIDGGVGVNNPAVSAAAEAYKLFPDEDITVVSLGAGQLTRPLPNLIGGNLLHILDVVFDATVDVVDYQMKHVFGDNFINLQTELTLASDSMDDASTENLRRLVIQASELISVERQKIDRIVGLLHD